MTIFTFTYVFIFFLCVGVFILQQHTKKTHTKNLTKGFISNQKNKISKKKKIGKGEKMYIFCLKNFFCFDKLPVSIAKSDSCPSMATFKCERGAAFINRKR